MFTSQIIKSHYLRAYFENLKTLIRPVGEVRALKTRCKPHKSKVQTILHRSYTQKNSQLRKKIIFFRVQKKKSDFFRPKKIRKVVIKNLTQNLKSQISNIICLRFEI